MTALSPELAARLATGVYNLNEASILNDSDRIKSLDCEPEFTHNPDAADATSPFAKSRSGALPGLPVYLGSVPNKGMQLQLEPFTTNFGYFAMGRNSARHGDWDGHMIVVTRGSMGAKGKSPDWISNYNIGLQPGPGGYPVHAGFNRIWSPLRDFVANAVREHKPTHIHCIGHSLGGALANLSAEMLALDGKTVSLYTFGAPRVGGQDFTSDLTRRLGVRTYRVYHPADPVPMIPMFPFLHAPLSGGIRLAAPTGLLFDGAMHDMEESYGTMLLGKTKWSELGAPSPFGDFQVDSWLQQAAKQRGGFIMHSAALLEKISIGLARLIKKAMIYAAGSVGAVFTTAFTALDAVAWLLSRAAEMVLAIGEEILGLVNAIFGFLGRVTNSVVKLTQSALRWVLDLLYGYLASVAKRAIDRLR